MTEICGRNEESVDSNACSMIETTPRIQIPSRTNQLASCVYGCRVWGPTFEGALLQVFAASDSLLRGRPRGEAP